MVKVVVLSPNEMINRADLVGSWVDESHYHTLVEEDMDLYLPPKCISDISITESCLKKCSDCESGLDEHNIVFKFRKNYFTQEEIDSASAGLSDAAISADNRGKAAGPRGAKQGTRDWVSEEEFEIIKAIQSPKATVTGEDPISVIRKKYENIDPAESLKTRGQAWLTEGLVKHEFNFDTWVDEMAKLPEAESITQAKWVEKTLISKSVYAKMVNSGICGWYDRYPRIPFGRATSYTRENPDKFAKSYPFLQALSKVFEELLPWRYGNQKDAARMIDPKFVVPETPFTTITVNKNFRTAAHYDPANMADGFANISVISKGDYAGGYLVFPEIGYAVNLRPRDVLFVNNQAGLHGNTELILEHPESERVTCIAFFHERMLELGSYDYEETRREFVDFRRLNPNHPNQKKKWNGITPGMWADTETKGGNYKDAKEWYDFLKAKGRQGEDWINNHHPWLKNSFESSGLGDFFL